MNAADFNSVKLLCDNERLKEQRNNYSYGSCEERGCDHYQQDIAKLINGDPREIEDLKNKLAYEKDQMWIVCTSVLFAAVIFTSIHMAVFF